MLFMNKFTFWAVFQALDVHRITDFNCGEYTVYSAGLKFLTMFSR